MALIVRKTYTVEGVQLRRRRNGVEVSLAANYRSVVIRTDAVDDLRRALAWVANDEAPE